MLTAAQQERYARHLLLDPLGGEGQERLLSGTVVVRLPPEAAQAARWAVRYLASSGVGKLVLLGAWADDAAAEAKLLGPWTTVLTNPAEAPNERRVLVALGDDFGEGSPLEQLVALDRSRALDPSSAPAAGAQAALEAVKRLAEVGRPIRPVTGR